MAFAMRAGGGRGVGLVEPEAALGGPGLALAGVDRWGVGGALYVGYLWTRLPEPPWSLMTRPTANDLQRFCRLAAPR